MALLSREQMPKADGSVEDGLVCEGGKGSDSLILDEQSFAPPRLSGSLLEGESSPGSTACSVNASRSAFGSSFPRFFARFRIP